MKRVFFSFYIFIICSLLVVQYVIAPILSNVLDTYLKDDVISYDQKLAKGVIYLMEEDLLIRPEETWPGRINELQAHFGYDISLVPYSSLEVSPKHMDLISRGQITVIDDMEYIYYKIKGSEMVLEKGPFSKIAPKLGMIGYLFQLGLFVFLAILTVVWIIPYWRKLRKISAAATAFGNGEFDTRAEITSNSALAPIATAFNTMADRIQQLMNSHKELTNAVSHELRTPISRIRFGLEMVGDPKETPEKIKRYTDGLYADVAELEELVTELLTFARFDREKPRLSIKNQSLLPFVNGVIADIVPEESPVSCQLASRLTEGDDMVGFDCKYLARALDNLLLNALRYGDRCVLVTVDHSADTYHIHIDDDGPGIPVEDRQKIFEPFTRLDSSRSRHSGGYGLGLAIVARIVKWHNGEISVSEGVLGGARFSLSLPGDRKK